MNKEECLKLAEALGMDLDVVEFPANSGMYVFVQRLETKEDDDIHSR